MNAPTMDADTKPTVSAGAIILKLFLACLGVGLGAFAGLIIAAFSGLMRISC